MTETPAPATIATEHAPRTSLLRKFINLIGTISSAAMNLFSYTALITVIVWSAAELYGYRVDWNNHQSLAVNAVLTALLLGLMLFEIFKISNNDQINKRAFLVDNATGYLEAQIFSVTITILVMQGRLDYGQFLNYMMFIFTLCDATLVLYNRYAMVARQITTAPSDGGHHGHHGSEHATVSSVLS